MMVGNVAGPSYEDGWGQGALLRVHRLESPFLSFKQPLQKEPASRFACQKWGLSLLCHLPLPASFGEALSLSNKHDSRAKCQQSPCVRLPVTSLVWSHPREKAGGQRGWEEERTNRHPGGYS